MYFKQILHNEVLWKSFWFEVPKHTTYLCLCVLPSSFWKCSLHCSIYSGVGDMTENYGLNWIWNDSVLSVFFFFSGVPCHHKTCFSRPWICFHPSRGCFHHCKHMTLAIVGLCVWYNPPARPLYVYISATVRDTKEALSVWLAWLQHVSHSWITCTVRSIVKSTTQFLAHLMVASFPWWPEVSYVKWARSNSPLCF